MIRCVSICLLIFVGLQNAQGQLDTLVLQPDSSKGKDAIVWTMRSQQTRFGPTRTKNYGSLTAILAHEWTWDGYVGSRKALIGFDLSQLPSCMVLISAKLSLFAFPKSPDGGHSTLSGANNCYLERIISPWEEGKVTWENQPNVSDKNRVMLNSSVSDNQDYVGINVTNLVKDMLNDPKNSHGFRLSMVDNDYYRRLVFASSDHPNPAKHPRLVIIYRKCSTHK